LCEPEPHLVGWDRLDPTGDDGLLAACGLVQPEPLDLALGEVVEAFEQLVGEPRALGMVEPESLALSSSTVIASYSLQVNRALRLYRRDPRATQMTMGVLVLNVSRMTCAGCGSSSIGAHGRVR